MADLVAFDPLGCYRHGATEPFDPSYDALDLFLLSTADAAGCSASVAAWSDRDVPALDLTSAERLVKS